MNWKFWNWTFGKTAKFCLILGLITFVGATVYLTFSLEPLRSIPKKLPLNLLLYSFLLNIFLIFIFGFAISFIFWISALVNYFFHLMFKDTFIEQARPQYKLILKNLTKEEKNKFIKYWYIGILYSAFILLPIVLLLNFLIIWNYLGCILSFLGFIVLCYGIPLVRKKVTQALSFVQDKYQSLIAKA